MTPWIIYAWVLMAAMFFAIFTGWGRKFVEEEPSADLKEAAAEA